MNAAGVAIAGGPAAWVQLVDVAQLEAPARKLELVEELVDDDDAGDVANEELGLLRCGRCRRRVPTRAGVVQPHAPGEGRTDECPASGSRIASSMRPIAALAFMAGAARVDVERVREGRPPVELEGLQLVEALRVLHVRWTATRQQPHAQLEVRKHVAPIIAASIDRLKPRTLVALRDLPLHAVLFRACAALELATFSPIAFLGGIADNGNPWGDSLARVLPFKARARRAGREGRGYVARYMRKAFERLADDGAAFRFSRKEKVAGGFQSRKTGKAGPWQSTGRVYPIRFVSSATYLATDPLRDLQTDAAHVDWARAVREVIRERFAWAWVLTRRSREWRRGYTYTDALITHPQEKRERAQVRAQRRRYWSRLQSDRLIPAQSIALREKSKEEARPLSGGARPRNGSDPEPRSGVLPRGPEEEKSANEGEVSPTIEAIRARIRRTLEL